MNYKLKRLFEIEDELNDSNYEENDIEYALSKIYEEFEGYLGIKTNMDEWCIDENGDVIQHTFREKINFYHKIKEEIYKMLIKKEYIRISENIIVEL